MILPRSNRFARARAGSLGSEFGLAALVTLLGAAAVAQDAEMPAHWEPYTLNSGVHGNDGVGPAVVFRRIIELPPQVTWARIEFQDANLEKGSAVRVTSLRDGESQTLTMQRLLEWKLGTAFFNGSRFVLELIAGPGTRRNYVEITRVWAGDPVPEPVPPEAICGPTDDRTPRTDARVGRILTPGRVPICTGFIIDQPLFSPDKCHLSAGHCFPAAANGFIEFGVLPSMEDCTPVHPPVARQFSIDPASVTSMNGGVGNDYAAFGCFENPTTQRTTFEEAGQAAFRLAPVMPAVGTRVAVIGHGADGTDFNNAPAADSCACDPADRNGTRHLTLQSHFGPLVGTPGTRVLYQADDCPANSGSPIVDDSDASQPVIGIQTHAGCGNPVAGTDNAGTQITHPGLRAAIRSSCPNVPANDECANAVAVVDGLNEGFNNVGATTSSAWPCGDGADDVWFSYTATFSGMTEFDTCDAATDFDTTIEVFARTRPSSCESMTSLGCNDDALCNANQFASSVSVPTTAGAQYVVRVGGASGSNGRFALRITPPSDPPNDECIGAIRLEPGLNAGFSNVGATLSAPAWRCGTNVGADVWFFLEPRCTSFHTVTVSTVSLGTSFDTVIEAFSGRCDARGFLRCNDNALGTGGTSSEVRSDRLTLIRVGGVGGATGNFDVLVVPTCACCPPVFSEDFEAGTLGQYTETDLAGNPVNTLWHAEQTCNGVTPIAYTMGTTAATYNQGDNAVYTYDTGASNAGALESPLIQSPPGSDVELSFQYWKHTDLRRGRDRCQFETRVPGGPWTVRLSIGGNTFCPDIDTATVRFPAPGPAWQHRFVFDSVDALANDLRGWAIDNVTVRHCTAQGGTFTTVDTGCRNRGLSLAAAGAPRPGGTVMYRMQGWNGTPAILVGVAAAAPQQICPPDICRLGVSPILDAVTFETFTITIPCDPTLSGVVFATQGVDLNSLGGCAAAAFGIPLRVSTTVHTTIGS